MRSGGRGWFWLALVGVLVVIALVGGRPPSQGSPFDPNGVSPVGAQALRETLEGLGADVTVSDQVGSADDHDVVLVLEDRLTDDQRDELTTWVADGGVLVIADPTSPLTPIVQGDLGSVFGEQTASIGPGRCTVDALADVGAVAPGFAATYETAAGDRQCFDAFVVEQDRGSGVQRSVGDALVFTNERLGEADNAVLAVRLVDARPGTGITWLVRDRSAVGEGSLWQLVSPGTRAALLQVAIAGLVYVFVRGRRLGPPVREAQPVQLAGSGLVAAVGHLMQRRRDPDLAARFLRADLRRELSARLGLAPDEPADLIARIVGSRFALDDDVVQRALVDLPVPSDDALVVLARDIETVRQEVLHGHAPAP